MKNVQMLAVLFAALIATTGADIGSGRKLLQTVREGSPSTITVSADNPNVNAITITLSIPYPQNAYFCNVTGDSRIPQQSVFPLTVRVPVGVSSTVVFANITGPIPGATCQGSSVVQQPGSSASVVQQQNTMQQLVNNPSSVVQQTSGGSSVVQQQYATSVNQQNPAIGAYMDCVGNSSSVVQQQGTPSSVVQQGATPSTVVQQQSPSTVVQQPTTPTSVVQQPAKPSPPTTVVQQPTPPSPPSPPTTVVQQPTPPTPPTSVVQQPASPSPPTTVVQQPSPPTPPTTVVQQPKTPSPPTTVVQQPSPPSSVVQQAGRHLLQVGTIEYISNNGSTGQPQLTVLDTVEGVPNINFKPTAAGQTATFKGALQVAVTTTNDGFGTPYIPYRVDSKLSPQCGVQVNFVSF